MTATVQAPSIIDGVTPTGKTLDTFRQRSFLGDTEWCATFCDVPTVSVGFTPPPPIPFIIAKSGSRADREAAETAEREAIAVRMAAYEEILAKVDAMLTERIAEYFGLSPHQFEFETVHEATRSVRRATHKQSTDTFRPHFDRHTSMVTDI